MTPRERIFAYFLPDAESLPANIIVFYRMVNHGEVELNGETVTTADVRQFLVELRAELQNRD